MLSLEQVAASLQVPQHCEQLAAVYQEMEATLRVLWPLLCDKQNSLLEDMNQPSLVCDQKLSPIAAMLGMVNSLVSQSVNPLRPTAAQQNKQQQQTNLKRHVKHAKQQQQPKGHAKQQQQQEEQQQKSSADHQQQGADG
jgi:hypothetical protein